MTWNALWNRELSALLFPRLTLARMKIEINGKVAATILQKRRERTVAHSVWSPFNQRGHNETMKNPGRFEGDSCSGGYEGDCDPTGGREWSDDCDGECMRGIDQCIKMSARTCQGLTCRMYIAYDNVRSNQLVALQSLPRRMPSPSLRAGIVFGIYARGKPRIFHRNVSVRSIRLLQTFVKCIGKKEHMLLVWNKIYKIISLRSRMPLQQ